MTQSATSAASQDMLPEIAQKGTAVTLTETETEIEEAGFEAVGCKEMVLAGWAETAVCREMVKAERAKTMATLAL
ncbi:hypothetical protein Bca4012_057963 [Brassica carinata]